MATREQIEAARQRVETARQLLAEERARAAEAARDAETDVELVVLEDEAAAIEAEIEAARQDTERQINANAARKGESGEPDAGEPGTTEQPTIGSFVGASAISQPALPFGDPETMGDLSVTVKE